MTILLQFDAAGFRERFDRRAFTVRHSVDGGLFGLPRLIALARALPAHSVEYNAGELPVSQDPALTPRTGLGPEETLRRIAECRSWLVLKNVEQDPEFGRLLARCIDELRPHAGPLASGIGLTESFVFVSSPGAVTPFHIDPEHNFLLQIQGSKTIHVFDPLDREVLPEAGLERFYAGGHRNQHFEDAWHGRAAAFVLAPGDGVHVPVTAPHWVLNGPQVSVSYSITFRSRRSERRANVYGMNARLRRLGLAPARYGDSPLRDAVKSLSMRALRRGERLAAALRITGR